jgi:hypothetical protein
MTPPLDEGHQKDLRDYAAIATAELNRLNRLRQSPPSSARVSL